MNNFVLKLCGITTIFLYQYTSEPFIWESYEKIRHLPELSFNTKTIKLYYIKRRLQVLHFMSMKFSKLGFRISTDPMKQIRANQFYSISLQISYLCSMSSVCKVVLKSQNPMFQLNTHLKGCVKVNRNLTLHRILTFLNHQGHRSDCNAMHGVEFSTKI